jgi:elongation factor G
MSELKLFGQGEMHLRVTTERLADRFGVTIQAHKPSVAYRESIRDPVTVRGRHKKQSGGHGQFGDVLVEVGPRGRGEGFAFAERVHGGSVPRQYFSSVEAGARDAMTRGPLGFPVVDVSVSLIDGSYHTVDSSDMAFRAAAKQALDEALVKARPVLLEPILSVTIYVPTDALARASALVSARRGQILGFEAREGWAGWEALRALIPEAEIGDLIVELRSATSGVGAFETKFDHLAELSGRAADLVVAARQKANA